MIDDLRSRIAAVVRDATGDNYDNGHMADPSILWHELGIPDAIDWPAVADAVIAELGLTREQRELMDGMCGQSINYTTGKVTNHYRAATKQHRYVTEWKDR